MFDPFTGPVLVRGEIVGKGSDFIIIKFQQSSAFWDESDIGEIGKELTLQDVSNSNEFSVNEKVIAKGIVDQRGFLATTQVTHDQFQPLGIDWKISAVFILGLIVFFLGAFIYKALIEKEKRPVRVGLRE